MKTFNGIIKSLNDASYPTGDFENLEIWTDNESHVVLFDASIDLRVLHRIGATYFEPEEIDYKETKEITNVRLLSFDMYWNEEGKMPLTDSQTETLTYVIKNLINIEH